MSQVVKLLEGKLELVSSAWGLLLIRCSGLGVTIKFHTSHMTDIIPLCESEISTGGQWNAYRLEKIAILCEFAR